jgi:glycosyltransferase involved in cell wall biosynthesis
MSNECIISIIIPTYNRSHLILKTLNSIKNQEFRNYEVVIVDDGSNDNTKEVVEKYISDKKLHNFYYYHKSNGERGAARNFGISKASGQWITFLDSDDLFYDNHLRIASEFIFKNNKISVFHSAYEFKNQKNEWLRKVVYPANGNLNDAILKGNLFSCFGMFFKSNVLSELNFEENRELSGSEDWLLWLLISARYKIHLQPQISGCMIQHDERSVLGFNEEKLLFRTNVLVTKLNEDKVFFERYGKKVIDRIHGHMLTYSALHILFIGSKLQAMKLFFKGLKCSPSELFKIRTLAFVKHLFLT